MKRSRKYLKPLLSVLLALVLAFSMTGCAGAANKKSPAEEETAKAQIETTRIGETGDEADKDEAARKKAAVVEDGEYSSKEEVAEYIHLFEHLPDNYITKGEAKKLGWVSSKGNLWDVAPGKSIGGDSFGNREGLLPEAKGRKYFECDIDYEGGYRNENRIIYSNDGLVYYTGDHYRSYELLYGEE